VKRGSLTAEIRKYHRKKGETSGNGNIPIQIGNGPINTFPQHTCTRQYDIHCLVAASKHASLKIGFVFLRDFAEWL
jgi:hypothetical protein